MSFTDLVLPTQYKPYAMLLETHLHRMFRRNEAGRTPLPHERRQSNCQRRTRPRTPVKHQPNEPSL